MLKLVKVNKYFYKNRQNEIHVIDNTSIEFGDKGLVALLGNSGCGKTTLLNVIGGLDKWNSGYLVIDGKKYSKRKYNKLNKLRNLKIGYIFQDYKILDEMTVFDNVAISLKMVGIKDKKIIKERVNYVLETLELYRFRNRPASSLSGGQRQRVGIARAIAKNPDIVICDEPTGNLDSKNSIEIMNIIKAISKEKLVILVTHEVELAKFYADRIIHISDGKVISDEENQGVEDLDYQMDNKIYLKDYKNHLKFGDKKFNINYYSDESEENQIDIVLRNGNLYIKTNNDNNIEVINEDSKYELVDEHYQKLNKSIYEKYQFKMEDYKKKNSSIYSIFTCLKQTFTKSHSYKGIKKGICLVNFVTGFLLVFIASFLFRLVNIEKKNYGTTNDTYVSVTVKKDKKELFDNSLSSLDYNYIIKDSSSISIGFYLDDYYQTYTSYLNDFQATLAYTSLLNEEDLVYGHLPSNPHEIVIDKYLFDKNLIEGYSASLTNVGIREVEEVVGRKVKISDNDFIISGVTDFQTNCIYIDSRFRLENAFFGNYSLMDYSFKEENFEIKKGKLPSDGEVLVNYNQRFEYPINSKIKNKKETLKVVGYYKLNKESDTYPFIVNQSTFDKYYKTNTKTFIFSTNDKEKLISDLRNIDEDFIPKDLLDEKHQEYLKETKEQVRFIAILATVFIIATLLEVYFMNRSAFLSRIREVGIYRAIGVKKADIYRLFMGEILYTTFIHCYSGAIVSYFFVDALTEIDQLASLMYISIPITILCMILILIFNLLIGLLPIKKVVRKTPAQILSRKDI